MLNKSEFHENQIMNKKNKEIGLNFILDIDGVLTDGSFYYSEKGKMLKKFGAHDNDGIKLLKPFFNVSLITADVKGFQISKLRAKHMGLKIKLVNEENRYSYFEKIGFNKCIFAGDGHYDAPILKKVLLGFAPKNSVEIAKKNANYVTKNNGGEGAVYEICMKIIKHFKIKL